MFASTGQIYPFRIRLAVRRLYQAPRSYRIDAIIPLHSGRGRFADGHFDCRFGSARTNAIPHPKSLVMLLLTGVLAACGSGKPPAPPAKPAAALTDGCYYGEGKPVLKIEGKRGTLLVSSSFKTFRVEAGGNEHQRLALFTPGFLFDGGGYVYQEPGATTEPRPWPVYARKFGSETRSYDMQPGTVPTIRMQWAAYGEWDLVRGAPC